MRIHFFEALERDMDFTREYIKLDKMISHETLPNDYCSSTTVNQWIEDRFRNWKDRGNYISFQEVRAQLGVPLETSLEGYKRLNVDMDKYFQFCEVIYNIVGALIDEDESQSFIEQLKGIIDTINANIEKCGLEIKKRNGKFYIAEKDAVAIEVASEVPELADAIVEYNAYSLKGDLKRKKELLKNIADGIEPRRKEFTEKNSIETKDFFFMINNMDIRHNNCDPRDEKNYCGAFDALSLKEKEEWYDRIYDQALALFVLAKQESRKNAIDDFRKQCKK